MLRVLNFIGFQLVWFGSVIGAAQGLPWFGPLLALAYATAVVATSDNARSEASFLALAAVFGYVGDSTLVASGVIAFPEAAQLGAPSALWMVGLWVSFSGTLRSSLGWLVGRPVLAALLGTVAGPLSYWAGARLGAIELSAGLTVSALSVAVLWTVSMPVLLAFEAWTRARSMAPAADRSSS